MENDDDLIVLQDADLVRWTKWNTSEPFRPPGATWDLAHHEDDLEQYLGDVWRELGPGRVPTTQPLRVYADMSPFDLSPASDWYSRFHQYNTHYNDRRGDPVNFKNEVMEGNK